MNDCPVCGRPGLIAGMDRCPQCGADLECFSLLDGLHESGGTKKHRYRGAPDSTAPSGLVWLLSGASSAILIGLVLIGMYLGMRMELLMDRIDTRIDRVTEQLAALTPDALGSPPRVAQPRADIPPSRPPSAPSSPPPSPWADASPAPWEVATFSEAPLPVARADITPPVSWALISRANAGERATQAFDGYGDWPEEPPGGAVSSHDTAWILDDITPREEKNRSKKTQRPGAPAEGARASPGKIEDPGSGFTDSEFAKQIADFDRRRDIARQRLEVSLAKYNARDLASQSQDAYP